MQAWGSKTNRERDRKGTKGREKEKKQRANESSINGQLINCCIRSIRQIFALHFTMQRIQEGHREKHNIEREIEKERSNRSTRRRSKDLTAYWLWQLQHFTWIAETWVFVACICFQQKKNERERDRQRGRERERGRKQVRSDSRWANERKLCSPFKSRLALK